MKISKKQLIVSLCSIVIFLISFAVMICDFVIPLNLWIFPVLTFFFCLSVGFFILCLVLGIIDKSPWYLFLSAFLSLFAIMYPFSQYDFWWIGLIVAIVLCSVMGIFSFILMGNKTEDIALNKSPEYKNYKQSALEEDKSSEQEELPKIKSFKD